MFANVLICIQIEAGIFCGRKYNFTLIPFLSSESSVSFALFRILASPSLFACYCFRSYVTDATQTQRHLMAIGC